VYRRRVGPDDYVGKVGLDSGRIYSERFGPDRYVARVKSNGRIYLHQALSLDDYVGRVRGMHSLAEGGAAFFLLLLPAVEGDERVARKSGDGEEG
jgi:hypothetical protein